MVLFLPVCHSGFDDASHSLNPAFFERWMVWLLIFGPQNFVIVAKAL